MHFFLLRERNRYFVFSPSSLAGERKPRKKPPNIHPSQREKYVHKYDTEVTRTHARPSVVQSALLIPTQMRHLPLYRGTAVRRTQHPTTWLVTDSRWLTDNKRDDEKSGKKTTWPTFSLRSRPMNISGQRVNLTCRERRKFNYHYSLLIASGKDR